MSRPRTTGFRLLLKEIRPVWAVVGAALGVLTVSVLATLAGPLLVQYFVDRATEGGGQSVLVTAAAGYLVVALVGGTARIGAGYLGVRSGWRIADSIRIRLLRDAAVERPVLEVERRPVGEVLEKVEGNADIIGRTIAEAGFRMIGNFAVAIGTLAVMFAVVPAAGAGIAVLMIGFCLVFTRLARKAVRRWEGAREQQAELFGFAGDSLAARDDLLPLGESRWATGRTRDNLESLYRTEGRAYIGGRAFWPLTQLFFAIAFGLGFGFGLQGLGQGTLTIGTLTMIYLYIDLLQQPMEEMSSQVGEMQQMLAVLALSARKLDSTGTPARPGPSPVTLPDGPLEVAFDQVTFGYGELPVLHDVSFVVAPGRSLGVVGQTGAGKSTIVNLLCGLAAPDSGRVLIGGVDAASLPPAEFARRVTVLSQRAHIFAASVLDNVTLFDNGIPRERVWEVLERLDAAGWVRELPDGLDTTVGAGARTLSEGEMQVLAGARALIRPYSVLIVDEGTSRLDPATERSWSALLDTVMLDRTVVMVEHRLGTLSGFDEVIVMDSGRIVDVVPGTEAAIAGVRTGDTR